MVKVKAFPEDSIEHKAYAAVADLPAVEPNDLNRLGYHVWLYLSKQYPNLREAVKVAQSHLLIPEEEAYRRIVAKLGEFGIDTTE
jgi:hypothetical protein